MVNPVGGMVSMQNSKSKEKFNFTKSNFKNMSIIFADTDENAFEARDLENDFHDMSTSKDPISSHGMYI